MTRVVLGLALIASALGLVAPAAAQDWPTRTVRIIIPLGAGGGGDVFTRLLAEELHKRFGQPFVVENRPGGGLNIGTRARLTEMFGAQASSIETLPRNFMFRYRSAQHWMDVFKTYYGPLLKTFAALQPAAQQALHDDIMALIARMNRSGDATMVLPSEYLEVVVTKR